MGSAPSDSLSTGSEEGSAGDSSTSNAYNASLKPLKSTLPGQAGDIRPAEAILEQFDRAQQYVLKNKGEFTAEQQAKLQVKAVFCYALITGDPSVSYVPISAYQPMHCY